MGYSGGSDGGVLASSVQVTGLKAGGVLSQASGTTVDWTAGNGQVVSYADPNTPSVTPVSWDAVTGYTPTNLATDETTVFAYNSAGTLVEILASALTALDTKNYIIIGSVTHISSVIIKIVASPGNVGYDGIGSFKDFASLVVGPANITGNVYGANGTNLNLNVIGGQAFILASNFRNDPDISDIITLPSETAQSFSRVYRQADPSLNIAYESLSTALIDPSKYDDGTGTLATVPATNWTIQRIFRSRTGGTFVAYGQQLFTSKSNAIAALESESFQEKAPLPLTLYRTSLVIEQNATDLSDLAQAEFFAQSSFRTNGLGSASATIPGVVTPGGSDKSVQFNDGNTFGGNTDFTYDKTTKALTLDTGTVKAFSSLLNNLEILGTSNTASAENDNWKIEVNDIYLVFYRRQNDAWVEVFTTGASLSTD
ncbi:hypothetical protein KAR91_18610, partial [Candidatus Pacearchaeota archaeon]|nr:hypothetical protein [Candidatus Pacearchaeota archaeon]